MNFVRLEWKTAGYNYTVPKAVIIIWWQHMRSVYSPIILINALFFLRPSNSP